MTRKKLRKTACKNCQEKTAIKAGSYHRFDGSINNVYFCRKCDVKTYIIKAAAKPPTNKEIATMEKKDGSYKLAAWRQDYLKNRSEPKKYEPMLYFHDLYRQS